MIIAKKGVFFIKIKQTKKTETNAKFEFELNQDENYF